MAEIIKTILAAKQAAPHGAWSPGHRLAREGRLGPEDGAACRAGLPGGFSKLDNRCWATARVGYQDESKCWWPMMELSYVRSRSAEPTHRERPAHIPRDHLTCSLDYFFLSLSQHLQLVSSTYFHALPSLFLPGCIRIFWPIHTHSFLSLLPLNT